MYSYTVGRSCVNCYCFSGRLSENTYQMTIICILFDLEILFLGFYPKVMVGILYVIVKNKKLIFKKRELVE